MLNCLSSRLGEGVRFYTDVLGMQVSDRLGTEGTWSSRLERPPRDGAHRQEHPRASITLAFDTVDIGQTRDMFDLDCPARTLARLGLPSW